MLTQALTYNRPRVAWNCGWGAGGEEKENGSNWADPSEAECYRLACGRAEESDHEVALGRQAWLLQPSPSPINRNLVVRTALSQAQGSDSGDACSL